jgi:hypothetical protein
MLTQDELFARMHDLEAELGALIVPTLGVPITPNPLGQVFPHVKAAMDRHLPEMREAAAEVTPFIFSPLLDAIPRHKVDDVTPYWESRYFPQGDKRLAYAVVARYRPRLIVEIGSGHSTKFMRRAARDHGLDTRIVSIDPEPRADIRLVADEFIQATMQTVDLSLFDALRPNDILFLDGSHLVMNGSDCVQFFLNILPVLPPGVLVHLHDIFLPFDYPYQLFIDCKSNEQYMVAMLLLSDPAWVPILPIYYAHTLDILPHGGGSFWMRRSGAPDPAAG